MNILWSGISLIFSDRGNHMETNLTLYKNKRTNKQTKQEVAWHNGITCVTSNSMPQLWKKRTRARNSTRIWLVAYSRVACKQMMIAVIQCYELILCSTHSTYQLDCKTVGFFSQNRFCVALEERKSLTHAKRASLGRFLASLPSLALCFQTRSRPFIWLYARTWIGQKYGLFCRLPINLVV